MSPKKKQTLIGGALTGTAGVFLTKALGLIYVIPYSQMCGSSTVFYSYGYTIYEYMLAICLAGLPYAIASLVAEYASKDDYQTVMMVKRMGRTVMLIFGVICFGAVLLLAEPLARAVVPTALQTTDYISKTKNVLYLISFALLTVPVLSYFKGYYQGLKELKVYSFAEVFEQIVRIIFLLGASAFCVKILKLDQVWAVYMGVISASIAACVCIVFFGIFDKKYTIDIVINPNNSCGISKGDLFKQLLVYATPYLISAVVSNGSSMLILLMFANAMEAHGTEATLITVYQDMINYRAFKLTSIPQVFATGFSLAIIPHITEAVVLNERSRLKELISKAINGVCYFAIPIEIFMMLWAKEIYFVLYGYYEIEAGTMIVQKSLMVSLCMTVILVMSSVLIALQMRKQYIIAEICRTTMICATFHFFVKWLGVDGYFVCKIVEYIFMAAIIMIILHKKFDVSIMDCLKKAFMMLVSCIPMIALGLLLIKIGVPDMLCAKGKVMTFLYGMAMGGITVSIYIVITVLFKLPQQLFDIDFSNGGIKELLKAMLGRRRRKVS